MTLKDVLEKMGIKLDAKVDETPDMSKLEEMEKQIEELSQKISGSTVEQKDEPANNNKEDKEDKSDMETIQKLQAQIKELQDANRALLDGTQQEEEKSIEENMFELYKIAKGGTTDVTDKT